MKDDIRDRIAEKMRGNTNAARRARYYARAYMTNAFCLEGIQPIRGGRSASNVGIHTDDRAEADAWMTEARSIGLKPKLIDRGEYKIAKKKRS